MASARQRKDRLERRRAAAATRPRSCLYCRSTTNEFAGEEHIMPTALGNTDLVLRPGLVCRPCNNGPLSRLDQLLCEFGLVAFMRVQLGIGGRSGKLPTARFSNAHLTRHENNHIVIDCKNNRPAMTTPDLSKPNEHVLTLTGRRMTEAYSRDLVRALYKIALGFVAYDHGKAVALSARFDEARRMILGDPFAGYLAVGRNGAPHNQAHFTYQFVEIEGVPTMAIHADLYGVHMVTDLDSRRIFDINKVALDEIALMQFRRQPTAPTGRPVNSGPRPRLIDVGFPLSGPQDRTSTSDLNNMPGTPGSALRAFASAAPQRASLRPTELGNSDDQDWGEKRDRAHFSTWPVAMASSPKLACR